MPLMTYINDRMTATYMMLKLFSKLFLMPLVNITYPLLHQYFPVLHPPVGVERGGREGRPIKTAC